MKFLMRLFSRRAQRRAALAEEARRLSQLLRVIASRADDHCRRCSYGSPTYRALDEIRRLATS